MYKPMDRISVIFELNYVLLGMISSSMRAITIKWTDTTFHLRVYFDENVTEYEKELANIIETEIITALPDLTYISHECVVKTGDYRELENIGEMVYLRYENGMYD